MNGNPPIVAVSGGLGGSAVPNIVDKTLYDPGDIVGEIVAEDSSDDDT